MCARPKLSGITPQFSFRLDPELRKVLELSAQAEGRTLGNYISRILEAHVENKEHILRNIAAEDQAKYGDKSYITVDQILEAEKKRRLKLRPDHPIVDAGRKDAPISKAVRRSSP